MGVCVRRGERSPHGVLNVGEGWKGREISCSVLNGGGGVLGERGQL